MAADRSFFAKYGSSAAADGSFFAKCGSGAAADRSFFAKYGSGTAADRSFFAKYGSGAAADRSFFAEERNSGEKDDARRPGGTTGATGLKWHVFKELREHPDFILLGLNRASHLTLPTAEIPPDALAFIQRKFAELKLPVRRA